MGPSYENDFSFLQSRRDAMNTIRKVAPSSFGSSAEAPSSRPSTAGRRRANSAVSASNKLPPPSRSSGRRPTIHSIKELGLAGEYDGKGNFIQDGDLEAGLSNLQHPQHHHHHHHRQASQPSPPSRRGRKGFKIHWPFQSVATDTLSIFTSFTSGTGSVSTQNTTSHPHHAHAGSQLPADLFPRRRGRLNHNYYEQYDDDDDDDKASITGPPRSTLIPDYVVNFLRGETPESVARRKHERENPTPPRRPGMRTVDVTYQHDPRRSHMAIMTRAEDGEDPDLLLQRSHSSHSSTATERKQILRDRDGRRAGRGGGSRWQGAMRGWRGMTLLNVIIVVVVFAAGFAGFVVAALSTRSASSWTGPMALFTGSCAQAAYINWALHALVNIAAVALLGGANYVFQVLSSPTRPEVARMHERQRWMELGIPSVRNLAAIGRGRAVLAVLVVVVAVVAQVMWVTLLWRSGPDSAPWSRFPARIKAVNADQLPLSHRYNAVISTIQTAASHNLIVVESSFVTGAQFSNVSSANSARLSREGLLWLQSAASSNSLANITTTACANSLGGGTMHSEYYPNILFVASETAELESDRNSLLATARVATIEDVTAALAAVNLTSTSSSLLLINNNNNNTPIAYCLAQPQPTTETCTVNLNGTLLAIILALNLVSLLLIAAALFMSRRRHFHPLVTLGDALSSFLRDPDPTTLDNALVTRQNYLWGLGAWGFTDGKYWSPSSVSSSSSTTWRWLSSPSLAQWASVGFWWLATTALTTGFFILAIVPSVDSNSNTSTSSANNTTATTTTTPKQPLSLSSFGATNPQTTRIVIGATDTSTATAATLLTIAASSAQILLAGLYLSTNALLTSFYLSRESCLYSLRPGGPANNHPRPLRVTSSRPLGLQTSSLALTLPRPVSLMLLLWFMGMGFVLSQACVVVSVVVVDTAAAADTQSSSSSSLAANANMLGVGLSGTALAIFLGMLVLLLPAVAALSARRLPAAITADGRALGNPLALQGGSCSAVVSARCHRRHGETDVWRNKVLWGVVAQTADGSVAHVTYSARGVAELDGNHRYV